MAESRSSFYSFIQSALPKEWQQRAMQLLDSIQFKNDPVKFTESGGASGTFTTADSKTVVVVNGHITSIT